MRVVRLSEQMRCGAIALVVVFAGCSEMQPSPVAPSATSPAVRPQPAPPTMAPSFWISINQNGGQAFTDTPWQSTVVVSSTNASVAPVSVGMDCGNGTGARVIAGFVGSTGISCSFGTPGAYTVRVSVVAPSGVTTSDAVSVTAANRPTAPVIPLPIAIGSQRIGGDKTFEEWRFNISSTEPFAVSRWDFGDGSSSDSTRPIEQHIYRASSVYKVTVTGKNPTRGDVTVSKDVTVSF